MKWNVYYYNINSQRVEIYNIFDHSGFMKDVKRALRGFNSRDDFAEKIRESLMYHFRSRAEWEIFIGPYADSDKSKLIKTDVCMQVLASFQEFIEYLLDFESDRGEN